MALIMNASCEVQTVVVFGNHFTLKPGQIKNFTDNIAAFMALDRKDFGFVGLPAEFDEPEYMQSEEGKAHLAKLKAEGVGNRIRKLKQVIYNNQVSLRQDLEKANLKIDPATIASDGEIRAMQELDKYQDMERIEQAKRTEAVKKLAAKLGPIEKQD